MTSSREWVGKIRDVMGTPLAVGRVLQAAKDGCVHGQFALILQDVPMEPRTAQLYLAIAHHPVLANTKYISHLPPTLTAQTVLSRVDPPILEAAIADGRVHPKLTPEEAKALFSPPPAALSDTTWSPDDALTRIRNAYALAFNAELDRAPMDRRDELIAAAIAALPQWAAHHEAARDPDLQDDVQAAQDELAIRDSEPGGYRFYVGGQVIGGVKSTYPDFAKMLLTAGEGATPLRRSQLDRRLDDLASGKLPTISTARNHTAVGMAIRGQGRWRRR